MREFDSLGLTPYHQAGGAVLNVGIFVALVFCALGVPHPWTGFFVGAVPTFLLFAWHFASEETSDPD